MKLLIVEDEKKTGEYLTKGLTEAGFVVDLADNGLNGYHLAMTGDYDLIILDIMLPDVNGWDIVRMLRSANKGMPILLLTALGTIEHRVKGLEFPYVYMVGMEEGFLPHQSSIDEDNIDEERRLAYVGITRAQKELTFTLCKERRQYGELVRPEPSRFLLELPQDDLIWEQERKVVSAEERMQKGQSHLANLKAMMAAKRGK